MFEDEVDEVGSDVEAYCPKCKGDTTHVVISKYEDEIRRVQCNPCGDVHSFRKPRGDVEDDVPEPIAAKKRAMMKKPDLRGVLRQAQREERETLRVSRELPRECDRHPPQVRHGFISEIMSDSKVEMTFKDARRVLVHNRKDMPGLPLAAEGDGLASNTKLPIAKAAKPKEGRKAERQAGQKREGRQAREGREKAAKAAREGPPRREGRTMRKPGHATKAARQGRPRQGRRVRQGRREGARPREDSRPPKPVRSGPPSRLVRFRWPRRSASPAPTRAPTRPPSAARSS